MMVGLRFPSLSVSLSFKRVIAPVTAALALLASPPQAWSVVPTFTVANTTFGPTAVGSVSTQNVTLTVNTAVPITKISIAPGFTEYTIGSVSGCTVSSSGTSIVSAGSVCTIAVTYSPAAPGSSVSPTLGRNAPLLVSDIESSNPVTYAFGLTGSATAAVSQLEPATLSLFAGAPLTGLPAPAQGLGITTAGYGGNNGPANEALFSFYSYTAPTGCSPYTLTQPMARDSAGNLYVIDPGNLVIRKIDNTSAHNVTIVAGTQGKGNTTSTFNNAYLDTPVGIVVDAAGNIYFLDTTACYGGFGLVRRVDAVTGAVTSVAGQNFTGTYNSASGGGTCTGSTGSPGYTWECGDGGSASYANIAYATQLAIDAAGNLYLWEAAGGGYIRKIDASTGIITTIATAAQLGVTAPEGGMTLAADGNFYVSVDTGTQTYIEQFNPNTQAVTQIAGGGSLVGNYCTVANAQAGYPASKMFLDGTLSASGDLSSDGAGNIYLDEGLCDGTGDILDDAAAVWRINLASGNAFLETKAAPGDGAEVGYNSYYGYVTDPRSAVTDGVGNLYFVTYNQIGLLSGINGALNYTSTIDYTTHPQTLTATYANIGNATEPNPTSSFVIGKDFVINSTGDLAACSAITDLAIGGSCNLDVEFTPVDAGNITDTLDLTEAGGGMLGLVDNNLSVALNGSALAEPLIGFAPPTINFGTLQENTVSADQAVTISSTGTGPLTISNFFPDNGSFTGFQVDSGNPGTCTNGIKLAGGDSCTINVQFAPTTLGNLTENLIVNSDASNTNVNLTATEFMGDSVATLSPTATLSPNPLAFGGQVYYTTSPAQAVTLSNTGSGTLTGITATITGTNTTSFSLTTGANECGTSLAAGSTCNFYVTFSPKGTGNLSATLSVADNASPSPQTVSLTGSYVYFYSNVGTTLAPQLVTVYITTAGTLRQIDLMTNGAGNIDFNFAAGGTCTEGTAYTVGETCSVNVSFLPYFPGARNGAVGVLDASGNVLGVTYLPGTGAGAQIAFPPAAPVSLTGTIAGLQTVALDGQEDIFYVDGSDNLIKLTWNGTSYGTAVTIVNLSTQLGTQYADALAIDPAGNIFVGAYSDVVVEVPWAGGAAYGTPVVLTPSGVSRVYQLATDNAGNLYIIDPPHDHVMEMTRTGTGFNSPVTLPFPSGGAFVPWGLAVDGSNDVFSFGEDGTTGASEVLELPATSTGYGTMVTIPVPGSAGAYAMTVDGDGDIYVSGLITSSSASIMWIPYGGNGYGYGSPAQLGPISYGYLQLAVDGAGNVFAVDQPTAAATYNIVELGVANPPSLTFASTAVGATSSDSPKTVPITNIGNGDLTIDGVSYPANFPENSNDDNLCVADNAVTEGNSCDISVDFTPTISGSLSGSVSLSDNNLNLFGAFQLIGVSGAATGAAPTATLTGITFGSETEGTTSAAMTATLTNTSTSAAMTITGITITGTNASDFTKTTGTNACGTSLAASSTCLLYATFKPSIVGGESATLSVNDNATGSPQTAALTGTGTTAGAPIATLTPALAFPATPTSENIQLQAMLSNTGTAPLTNIAATVTGANGYVFKIYPNGSCYNVTTLAAGASCTISINFYPPGPGYFAAVLSVTDNAAGSPQTSILTGEGTESALQFTPGQLDYVAGTPGKVGDTGSGPATSALIGGGYGITLDSTGLVYISDYTYNAVWQIDDNGNINLFAGDPSDPGGYGGDGGSAQGAMLKGPGQIAFDPAGNFYIADRSNNLVRIVTSDGTINTFAGHYGNGFGGYAGDGGPANQATLSGPQGVTSDPQGNIYISDTNNFVIRKVDLTGKITLFAGTPNASGYSGDNGPATSAKLGQVYHLATDANGNLYMADFGSGVVRKVDSSGTITTYAGGGTAPVTATPQPATSVNLNNGPVGLATDAAGNLYVLGLGPNNAPGVFVVNSSQQISRLAGGGSTLVNGGAANFEDINPNAIAVDSFGDLYVNDAYNHLVSEIGPNGDLVFPSTPVNSTSAPLTVTLSNTGNAPLQFANQNEDDVVRGNQSRPGRGAKNIADRPRANVVDFGSYGSISGPFAIASGGTCNFDDGIAAGASCTMNVTFTPTAAGPATGEIFLYTSSGTGGSNSNEILLSGTGTAVTTTTTATLTPSPLAFGGQVINTTSLAQVAALSNTGTSGLTGITPTLTGANPGDYTILTTGTNICGATLAAGSSCNIYVSFAPAATGSLPATLSVADSATGSPQTASLTGTGVQFQSNVGQATNAQAVSVYFATSGTLHTIQVLTQGIANLDFTMASGGTCATGTAYTVGESCTVDVIFTPQAPGARNGSILLTDASSSVLGTAYLPGLGYGPEIAYYPGAQSTLPSYSNQGYSQPLGVSTDAALNVYVADTLNNRIIQIPQSASGFGTPVKLPATGLNQPSSVAIDGNGNVFIADTENFQVVELPWNGTGYGAQVVLDASGLPDPDGIAVDGNGNVYFADGLDQKVVEVPWTGAAYGAPVTIAQATGLHSPHGVAVDATGDLFIADSDNNRVVELPWTSSGFGTEVVLATGLFYPEAVAVDGGGNVYAGNTNAGTVIMLPWNGESFGSQATLPISGLRNSTGVAVDSNGNVYVADAGNNDAVMLNVSNPPTLSFAATNVGSTSSDSPKTVSITNIGNEYLYFYALDNNPAYPVDFPINNNDNNLCSEDSSVNPGSSCDVSVNFTPTVAGSLSEDVVLTDNNLSGEPSVDGGVTQSIPVNGKGIGAAAPVASLTPGTLTFTAIAGTTSASQTATLSNTGNATLTISGITITGTNGDNFNKATGSNACGETLAADASCLIYVTFSAPSVGSFTATLTVTDDASPTTQSTTLNGTGTAPPDFTISATPATQTVQAGASTSYTVTVKSTGGDFTGAVALTASGLPTGATASFAPTSVSPGDGSGNSTLTIQTAGSQTAQSRTSFWPLATPALALLFLLPMRRWRKAGKGKLMLLVVGLVSLASALTLMGCGAGFALVQPSQTYTITITGTSGTDTHSTTVQLTVQ